MRIRITHLLLVCLVLALSIAAFGTAFAQSVDALVTELERRWEQRRPALYYELQRSDNPTQQQLNENPNIQLMGIDGRGHPMYYITHNDNAAATIRTNEIWPSGLSGHNLTGVDTPMGVLGIWDSGLANPDHVDFVGRSYQADGWPFESDHATHVGGTMIGSGLDPAAKGMSYAAYLASHRWDDDTIEMAQAAANGMQISNHSYGIAAGWNGLQWYGDLTLSTNEDWRFGFYDSLTAEWDMVARSNMYYLIVKSAGNDRNDTDPGSSHQHYVDGTPVWADDYHPPDGSPFGFDTISDIGVAKNILTVGAVEDIPSGYNGPQSVVQTDFSSWGPADDGRIKPDIVANGDSVYSARTYPDDDTSYGYKSGTSMATPSVSGSINLIRELYEDTYIGSLPLSSTLKALVIHTADEAGGANGPDYSNGWGLMNSRAAADLVAASPSSGMGHVEGLLVNGGTDTYYFYVESPVNARVTMVWTDIPGTPPPYVVDPVAKMLVNDLDVRLQHLDSGTSYYPWRLDKNNPLGIASQGDNDVDNVERIDGYGIPSGNYRVAVSHKGSITGGEQPYSLVWSGLWPTSATGVEPGASPPRFTLATPYPNPASGGIASIGFTTDAAGPVSIEVFDARGRHVKTLLRGVRPAGPGSVRLDTGPLPSGVYFVKMRAASKEMVKKITVVR